MGEQLTTPMQVKARLIEAGFERGSENVYFRDDLVIRVMDDGSAIVHIKIAPNELVISHIAGHGRTYLFEL
jgi:hypothetical protein